jgi:hypothetical protein
MSSRLTQAMEEVYAAVPSSVVVLHTVEANHASFPTPIRVVTGDDGLAASQLVPLTLETGETVDFTAMAFDVTPPGFDDKGPTPGRIRLDLVSGELIEPLEAAATSAGAIEVTYRAWRSDQRGAPGDVVKGLKLRRVALSETAAEGDVGFDEVGKQAFPRQTYSIDLYPALFNQ